MIKLIFILLFLFNTSSFANFKSGDILLQPLHCHLCNLIEIETGGPYSHIGMLIQKLDGEWSVIEAFGEVRMISVEEFLSKTQKGEAVVLGRFEDLSVSSSTLFDKSLMFLGLPYDSAFLWDNFNDDGKEYLYCTELVTKILEPYLAFSLPLSPMTFTRSQLEWERYFQGPPPEGLIGNSPMDFFRMKELTIVGKWSQEGWIFH